MSLPVPPMNQEALEAALRQETAFRARAIADFRAMEEALRKQQQLIDSLNTTLGGRDTYIHKLHLEKADHDRAIAAVRAEVEKYAFEAARLTAGKGIVSKSWIRPIVDWLLSLDRPGNEETLPGSGHTYHLDPSPFRVFTGEAFELVGWVRPKAPGAVALLRARIGSETFRTEGSLVTSETETGALNFRLPIKVPTGHSLLRLETADADGRWTSLLNAPLWRPAHSR